MTTVYFVSYYKPKLLPKLYRRDLSFLRGKGLYLKTTLDVIILDYFHSSNKFQKGIRGDPKLSSEGKNWEVGGHLEEHNLSLGVQMQLYKL